MHLDHLLQSLDGLPEAATRMTHQGRDQIEEIKSKHLHEVIQLAAASRRKDAEIVRLREEIRELRSRLPGGGLQPGCTR